MFQRWGFLLGEIWGLLLLAALLGVLVGWLIWGRRSAVTVNTGEVDGLRASLDACTAKGRDQTGRIAALESDLAKAKSAIRDAESAAAKAAEVTAKPAAAMAAPLMAAPAPIKAATPLAAAPLAEAKPQAAPKVDTKTPAKPQGLDKARGGKADDLKMIKGIGPKLEILCNTLGYFHFDQIATWTTGEIAWVDDNLEGFKGRVTRDEWVKQAKVLAKGGTTEFANRVKDGDVY